MRTKAHGIAIIMYLYNISHKIMRHLGENNIRTIHSPKEKDHKNTEACQGWIRPVGPGCIIDSM
jgi:hypothetical protein